MPFMTKIFVASSTSAKSQAKAFIKGCNAPDFTFLPWWDEFVAGKTLLEELTRIQKQVQKAVVILSPESDAKIRGHRQQIPNLNVLFEFGFFYGTLGKDNVAIVRYGQIYLPSDLDGYIHITGSSFFKRNAAVPVSKRTKAEFERWLHPHKNNSQTKAHILSSGHPGRRRVSHSNWVGHIPGQKWL